MISSQSGGRCGVIAVVAARRVAPVVITSSQIIRRHSARKDKSVCCKEKASCILANRSSRVRDVCGAVSRTRTRRDVSRERLCRLA